MDPPQPRNQIEYHRSIGISGKSFQRFLKLESVRKELKEFRERLTMFHIIFFDELPIDMVTNRALLEVIGHNAETFATLFEKDVQISIANLRNIRPPTAQAQAIINDIRFSVNRITIRRFISIFDGYCRQFFP